MSVFRVEKNKNYTTMANYHFSDIRLSLKAIGLLSKMLSLPDDWDYSQAGLVKICKDGESSVASALKELETNGYLIRERERDSNGRVGGMIYHVYEMPFDIIEKDKIKNASAKTDEHFYNRLQQENPQQSKPQQDKPVLEQPKRENPVQVNAVLENSVQDNPEMGTPEVAKLNLAIPNLENAVQQNTKRKNTKTQNTKINYPLNQSEEIGDIWNEKGEFDRLMDMKSECNDLDFYKIVSDTVKKQIGYSYIKNKYLENERRLEEDKELTLEEYDAAELEYNLSKLNDIATYITDFIVSENTAPVRIGEDIISRRIVKEKLLRTDLDKTKAVIRRLGEGGIKNPKAYTITMLYNA